MRLYQRTDELAVLLELAITRRSWWSPLIRRSAPRRRPGSRAR
jgi:hypothetical protein